MIKLSAEQQHYSKILISPMSVKRDWMDETPEKHAYRCFPVTQANMIGWNLSFSKDISFIWNGINDTSSENIEIIEGKSFSYSGRGQSTISFNTGLIFKSQEKISLLTINPVNYFDDRFETVSSLISTSWYDSSFPLAIKAKEANKETIIKAGEPVATIIPVSLSSMDNTCIDIFNYLDPERKREEAQKSYGEAAQVLNTSGQWTDWYRDAVNEKGESLGEHETKALRLHVIDHRNIEKVV
jgi:antitoxin (DNA-binding transcriptional repressor) of toxin-antitoxin stability system